MFNIRRVAARITMISFLLPPLLLGAVCAARPTPPVATDRPQPAQVLVTFGGKPGRITAIPSGTVTIKRCHHTGCLPESAASWARFAAILADVSWAEPMPVWSYLIEHPEGVWLVDAGASPRYRDPEAWSFDPVSRALIHSFIRLDVSESETVPARMRAMGVDPAGVRGVLLTHQHVDHTGSVPEFPQAEIWTTAAEDAAAPTIGAMHPLWRTPSARIRYVDQEGAATTPPSVPLTSDRRVEIVSTPGHTPGSLSVRVAIDGGDVWMIGDTAFTTHGADPDAPTAGIHADIAAVRGLHRQLQAQVPAARRFPSHDPDVPQRLLALGSGR